MRARLDDLARAAIADHGALGAYTCYDLATADAIIGGAERAGLPVVLLVPPVAAGRARGAALISALRGMADAASVAACVQLDHATDADLIVRSVAAGADAVLVDGSALSTAENAAFVAEMRSRLPHHTVIEAELGALAGDEDRAVALDADASAFTDPAEAGRFVAQSGAQLLAVSIGNVHGAYRGAPRIEHDRLARIQQATEVPLVLHGASGISTADLRAAAARGVGKVNINTELRGRLLDAVSAALAPARLAGDDVATLTAAAAEAVSAFVAESLTALRTPHLSTPSGAH
ncbi:class II fructose-bisphosphate aldolase [Leucobacter musarum]|uniref:class II fructose-bisphosphate aldolase n=1 Tax=Leucobacter musarum TaxID=1930747 RepID=UPI0006A7A2CF|nr:class II fructose-bisphosphate aldolase [Leucobacter musarum]